MIKQNECNHHEHISSPVPGKHIIGRCLKCGREVDYTILQERDRGFNQICLANTLTRPNVSMEKIMHSRTGNGKRKPEKQRLSRGRVR